MLSGAHSVPPFDPELRQLMEDFDRGVFEQSQSPITEYLRMTLPYQTGPDESGAVEIPSGSRIKPVLEGFYDGNKDEEFINAPELVEVLRQPSLCKCAFLSFATLFLERAVYSLRVCDSLTSVVRR